MYLVKSAMYSISKNGKSYIKLSLVSENGSPVGATCFTTKKYPNLVGMVVDSNLDPNSQFPNVFDTELDKAVPLSTLGSKMPEAFLKFTRNIPVRIEFVGVVEDILNHFVLDGPELRAQILNDAGYLYQLYSKAPAALAMHHAYPGGLAQHTYEMLKLLVGVVDSLPFEVNPVHCVIGILFHDFGKLYEYAEGTCTEIIALTPHVFLGAQEIGKRYSYLFSKRELNLVQHIVLAHHGKLEWGSPCVPATLEAFLVHHLDMLSGHGYAMSVCENLEKCPCTQQMVIKP